VKPLKKKVKKDTDATSNSKNVEISLESDNEESRLCSAYIHVQVPPPPLTRVSGKGVKPLLPQIHKSSPLIFKTSISHEVFLDQLSSTVPCRRIALPHSLLRWKFEKPIKGDDKPLTGEAGFKAMVTALDEKKRDRVVIITMPPPVEVKGHSVCPLILCSPFYLHF
jgi:hypothetical protein